MAQQFTNNARALLTSSIAFDATSLVVESTKADLFPVANVGANSLPSANSWFKVTLQDSSGNIEIVAVRTRTAGSGVMSNVIRGYDGTTARDFTAGTVMGLRITAEDVQTALDLPNQNNVFTGDNSFSGNNEFTGTQTFSDITTFSGTTSFSDDVAFNDSPTAPTVTYGDATAKLATTAFVQAALQALYPVGSIYTNAGVTTNPAVLFGFGTWAAFGAGRVMVGLNGSDSLFDALEETGGSKDATVVSHSHSTGDAGAASGTFEVERRDNGTDSVRRTGGIASAYGGASVGASSLQGSGNDRGTSGVTISVPNHAHSVSTTGSSGTNANLQPYITVAMWKRTA